MPRGNDKMMVYELCPQGDRCLAGRDSSLPCPALQLIQKTLKLNNPARPGVPSPPRPHRRWGYHNPRLSHSWVCLSLGCPAGINVDARRLPRSALM